MNPYIFCILGFYLTGTQISFSIGYPSHPSYGDQSSLYTPLNRKLEHSSPFDANELKADLEGVAGKTVRIENNGNSILHHIDTSFLKAIEITKMSV